MKHHIRTIGSLLCAFSAAYLAGCAAPADPAAMVPAHASVCHKFNHSVGLSVTGGQNTNPMWTSQVSSEDFRQALEMSLQRSGVFSRVINNAGADYQLSVMLVRLKQPLAGFDMTVTAEVTWKLTTNSGRVVWEQTTNQSYTAKMGDAFAGVNRLRLANEGAIRESIRVGIERISELSL